MKLDDLLREYGEVLPSTPMPSFDQMLKESRKRQFRKIGYAGLAIAAIVLLGVFLLPPKNGHQPSDRASNFAALTKPPSVAFEDQPQKALASVVTTLPQNSLRRATKPLRRSASTTSSSYDWSGFIPVAETTMLPSPRLYQVVRVNVSRDRLAALGVVREGGDERITADVLVGDDGMTWAVKVIDRAEQ